MNYPHPASDETYELMLRSYISVMAPPPKARGLLEFARTLKVWARNPDTGEDEWIQFEPTDHPAQLEILKAFRAGECDELLSMGPVQDGKTFATTICCVLYCLIELRQSVGLMAPEQDKVEEIWLEKFIPVIKASGYEWILPTEGRGARSGAGRFQQLNTGATIYLIGAGARNESAQSSFTVRFMFVEEASGIRPRWILLAWARTASYDRHGRNTRTSTIKDDLDDSTVNAFEDSTRSRNVFKCPHCVRDGHPTGGWQIFDFDLPAGPGRKYERYGRLHYDPDTDDTARESARLVCLHNNAHLITDAERKAALRDYRHINHGQSVDAAGNVVGTTLPNARKGIRWCALESPIKSLGKLAVTLRKALIARDTKGDHEPLRQYERDECVWQYTGDRKIAATAITSESLARLSTGTRIYKRTVPSWAEFLAVGKDVQGDRHYNLVLACGSRGREAIIDYGYDFLVPLDKETKEPTRPVTDDDQLHELERFDAVCAEGWPVEGSDTHRMVPVVSGFDVNYRTDLLLPWAATHQHWTPCIGVSTERAKGMQRTSMREGKSVLPAEIAEQLRGILDVRQVQSSTAQLAFIHRSQVQQNAHAAILLRPEDPGVLLLPEGTKSNEVLAQHLSSRVWTRNEDDGVWYFREVRKRDDLLACLVIARALARFWRVYQPWLAAQQPADPTPRKPSSSSVSSSLPTTPDGRPLLLSDR